VTTHGQPAVAHNGETQSAAPAESGPKTVAAAAPTPTVTDPAEGMTAVPRTDFPDRNGSVPIDRHQSAPAVDTPAMDAPDQPSQAAAGPLAGRPRRPPAEVEALAVPGHIGDLALALRKLRTELLSCTYPLVLPSTEQARRTSAALVDQLDDYLLPRLARLDAPLLVVVGGSTGAGKSTLVNSLVRAPVSPAGVLRPTTRAPVLVSHPADAAWFRHGRLLPGLSRTAKPGDDPHTLRLVEAPALTPGLALVDAPDVDSVVATNRKLAAQLLSAADLWLFVTSAARYADAVPWELLRTAAYRGTAVALVLDRVPPAAADEVVPHLTDLLGVHGFRGVPLFVLPEAALDGQGLLAEEVVAPIAAWLAGLAGDETVRAAVIRQTVDGALATIEPIVAGLAEAAEEQAAATRVLTDRAGAAYRAARARVDRGLRDGTLLRGEVLARWRELVGTGELIRVLKARSGRALDRVVATLSRRRAPGEALRAALESAVAALVQAAAADGTEQAYTGWQAHPSGAALARPDLAHPSGDLARRVERLVRDWRQGLSALVDAAAGSGAAASGTEYANTATSLLVMVGMSTSAAAADELDLTVADGRTVAAQHVLDLVFGDESIRALVQKAREDLLARVDQLLDAEAGRFLRLLPTYGFGVASADRLREAGEQVERARRAAALTTGTDPVELALPSRARMSEEEG